MRHQHSFLYDPMDSQRAPFRPPMRERARQKNVSSGGAATEGGEGAAGRRSDTASSETACSMRCANRTAAASPTNRPIRRARPWNRPRSKRPAGDIARRSTDDLAKTAGIAAGAPESRPVHAGSAGLGPAAHFAGACDSREKAGLLAGGCKPIEHLRGRIDLIVARAAGKRRELVPIKGEPRRALRRFFRYFPALQGERQRRRPHAALPARLRHRSAGAWFSRGADGPRSPARAATSAGALRGSGRSWRSRRRAL
jgi:hypothetical protein